ncbi:MAG: hypothetical protein R3C56_39900 [Pirellulaceae bacterium]
MNQSKFLRRLLIAGVLLLVAIVFTLARRADTLAKQSSLVTGVTKSTDGFSLVGTWIGDSDNVLNLRSDGTMRAADRGDSVDKVQYYEWNVEQNAFEMVNAPRKKRAVDWLGSAVLGMKYTRDRYEVRWIDADTVEFTNAESKTFILKRCSDATVQNAP